MTGTRLPAKPKNVLILGGYGRAGKVTAALLAKWMHGCITIAGRNIDKARVAARDLAAGTPSEVSFVASAVDARRPAELSKALASQDLIITCSPIDGAIAYNLAKTLLESDADYIDVVPSQPKYPIFRQHETAIKDQGKSFILDAGVDPGLPGWLAIYAGTLLQNPREVTVFAKYRDPAIGRAGLEDILTVAAQKPRIFSRQWQPAPPWQARLVRYPGGLGSGISLPLFLEELREAPQNLGVERLAFFHSGINVVSDLVLVA